ncbi:MAG TPA: ABC transporter permease [Solirubrobacterales bacterium]|jgi:ribose transport system permease protein|nr:ABC transporter permease [Solirubrobacterales bacterium]
MTINRDRVAAVALPLLLVAFIIIFSLLKPELFFTTSNLRTILVTQAVLAILSLATMIPLILGEFDLSVGANLGLGAILATGLQVKSGSGFVIGIVIALIACSLVGLINGIFVVRFKINAFIATLAMSTILSSIVLWYSGGSTLSEGVSTTFKAIGHNSALGIPLPVIYVVIVGAVLWYLTEQTPLGRQMYAIGGSRDAARLSGVRVDVIMIGAFVLTGFIAGIAGVLQAASLGSGSPTIGPAFLLPAFAAAFLGATAIRVGQFNVIGTVLAVLTLQTGITGLQLLGAPYYIEGLFNGVALLVAVGATVFLRRAATA